MLTWQGPALMQIMSTLRGDLIVAIAFSIGACHSAHSPTTTSQVVTPAVTTAPSAGPGRADVDPVVTYGLDEVISTGHDPCELRSPINDAPRDDGAANTSIRRRPLLMISGTVQSCPNRPAQRRAPMSSPQ